MFLTQFLLFFIALHFLRYAKQAEQIIINEWLTILCTAKNIRIAKFAIIVDLILNVLTLALANLPTSITLFTKLGL